MQTSDLKLLFIIVISKHSYLSISFVLLAGCASNCSKHPSILLRCIPFPQLRPSPNQIFLIFPLLGPWPIRLRRLL